MLSAESVDWIFGKLAVRYGARFAQQYADINPTAVKSDWGHVLDGFDRHPDALLYALENLPDIPPPNALQFRAIARRAPAPATDRLMPPQPDRPPQAVRDLAARMARPKAENLAQQCIENIERIVNARGGKISTPQREMVASCLRMPGTRTTLPLQVAP